MGSAIEQAEYNTNIFFNKIPKRLVASKLYWDHRKAYMGPADPCDFSNIKFRISQLTLFVSP